MTGERSETALDVLRKQLRPVMFHVGAVSFFINLLVLPVSLYSLQVLDRVMATGSLSTLFWLTLIMLILFAVSGALQYLRSIMLQRVSDWGHEKITLAVLPITLHTAAVNAKGGSQTLRDANSLKQFLSGAAISTLMDAPWTVLYLAVLFIVHAMLGFLVTGGVVALFVLAWLNESLMRLPLKQAGSQQLKAYQDIEFATRNADVIEAMGMRDTLIARWYTLQAKVNALQGQASGRSAVIQGVTKFVRLTMQILVTCVAAWLAIKGEVTVGAIIASSILSSRALAPFEAAIGSWKAMTDARGAHARLQQALQTETRNEGISLPAPQGALSVENLYYVAAAGQAPILRQVSFQVAPGECLGVIGHSGSGKSTLARLITGILRPASGIVRLDNANVFTWPRQEFGKFTGYLPQDVELFGGTVKDNIARLQDDAADTDIVQAAQMANAHDLILRLPQGYETDIGPNGANLSAGQRQRIGLARAFFGNPRLLILDEPDASLDDTGKAALVEALKHAKRQRMTVILITHRKSLLSCTDKILALKNGAVESFAATEQLMRPAPQLKLATPEQV